MCSVLYFILQTTIILIYITQVTSAACLRCYSGSMDSFLVIPLGKPLSDKFKTCINAELPTMIYTFGYRGKVNGLATTTVITAHLAKKKRNVLLLDWEEEANGGRLGFSLGYALNAVPNAKRVGKELGEMIVLLAESGMNMTDIHLLGHSLGAHLMGFAGRKTRELGHIVPRITGLDPARALFQGTFSLHVGLDRTCAKFVDIIHTDPGDYGTSISTGTVDIWPNFSLDCKKQPGCSENDSIMFSPDNLCSHDRSWRYYVESISYPTAFPAKAAENYESWIAFQDDDTFQTIYLGELTNTKASGNFFLSTNAMSPFGMSINGLKPPIKSPEPPKATEETNIARSVIFKFL